MGVARRFGLALALTCLSALDGLAQEGSAPTVEELTAQELASFEPLDAFVGRHLDGWLLEASVPDDDVELLLALYQDVERRRPGSRPQRRWLVRWSYGKRLLARGDADGAAACFERVLDRAVALTAEDPSYGTYLWRAFEDLAPLALAGRGAQSFDEVAGACFAAMPAARQEHPWLLQIVVDERVRASDFATAHELLEAARDDYASTGVHPAQILDYLQAYAHLAEGRPVLAQPLAQRAFDFFWEEAAERPTAFALPALEVLVDVWSSLGAHALVVDRLPRYLQDDRGRWNGLDTSRLQLALAISRIEEDELDAADALLGALCRRADVPDAVRAQAHSRLADLALRAGSPERAMENVERSLAARREGELTTEELALPLALGLRATRRAGRASDGLERFLPELERRFEEVLSQWSRQPLIEGGLGLLRHTSERTLVSELLLGISSMRGAAAAFEALVRVEATSTLARHLGGQATTVEEVRRALVPADGGLIDFFFDEDVLHVFAVDRDRVVHETVEERRGLSERIARYQGFLLRAPAPDEREARLERWRALSEPLAQELFPGAVRTLLTQWRDVRLVSSEILGAQLSLASLPVVSSAPLGVERAVSALPSIPVGLAVAGRTGIEGGADGYAADLVLLTNASRETPDSPPFLRMSEGQIQALTDAFDADRVRLLTEANADLPRLRAAVADARMLHVFEHGIALADGPVRTAALVTPSADHDGVLDAEDLLGLAPLPPLVVLSVCGATRGLARVGDPGAADLRGASLRAGARTVFAATGDVNQLATQRLMVHVHRALAAGRSPARALQDARKALASEDGGRFRDPYYTCLIQVLGRAHAPLFETARLEGDH